MDIDIIAFGAHPDDAEMGCGGLLLKLKDKGYKTGIIDLTLGELSTNGNLKVRAEETRKATQILRLDLRDNLKLEDSNIVNDLQSRKKVIKAIRKYRPRMAIIPYHTDRHPDHENSYKLLKDSLFASGLEKLKTGQKKHRPQVVASYMMHHEFTPAFIVDISDYFEQKMKAVTSYQSQIHSRFKKNSQTRLSSKYFMDLITTRDKCHGLKIMAEYGEPYFAEHNIKVDDPLEFFSYIKT
ncbi:MAG: bacillithiol biosynthesis deacetylase BshB1 [Actinomycetota bacterium]